MFRNILVAVDGSPDAEEALTQAIDLAESEHTRLTLITGVQKLPPAAYTGLSVLVLPQLDAENRSWAEAVLSRARDRVPDDLPVTTILTDRPIRTGADRADQAGTARPDRHGLARARRSTRGPPGQRQPLRAQPQPDTRIDLPRRHPCKPWRRRPQPRRPSDTDS